MFHHCAPPFFARSPPCSYFRLGPGDRLGTRKSLIVLIGPSVPSVPTRFETFYIGTAYTYVRAYVLGPLGTHMK
jgi:hypothetical protein